MALPEIPLHPLVIPIAVIIYGLLHSLTASLNIKNFASQVPGLSRFYRLLYSFFAAVSLLPLAALILLIPDRPLYTIPRPFVFITILVQLVAMTLLIYSLIQTGALQFIGIPQALGRETTETLNTKGLYRYVRHPLYSFSLLFIWMTPMMTRNIFLLFSTFTAYFLVGALLEERKLLKIFGPAYAEYQAKTPFMIPFLKL
jgi:protein-S-isoprenylcysteine O-methyltransferase Ste14